MPKQQAEFQETVIVLVGNFNAAIFHPAWFASEKLIQKQEAETAKIEIVHPDTTIFSLDWCRIVVTTDRFHIGTSQEYANPVIRDLVIGTFRLLRHTPIKFMGINRNSEFRTETQEAWHGFGHKIAPKELWNNILHKPGLVRMIMQESPRQDAFKGSIHVSVGTSENIKEGVRISINDHYEVSDHSLPGCDEIITTLQIQWDNSLKRASTIIDSLVEMI